MKVSCGVDIIEISRIKSSIENLGEKFINQIYTKQEIEYCENANLAKYERYAARFAAKEAVFKAVSIFLKDKYEISWHNAEVVLDDKGNPKVNFIGVNFEKIQSIDISISHCKEYAVANVVILYN